MKIIGIAGGSGAGKSTVSYALEDENPNNIEVLNFDDYQKVGTDETRPMIDGKTNWDHPDIIRWDDLISDIQHAEKRSACDHRCLVAPLKPRLRHAP